MISTALLQKDTSLNSSRNSLDPKLKKNTLNSTASAKHQREFYKKRDLKNSNEQVGDVTIDLEEITENNFSKNLANFITCCKHDMFLEQYEYAENLDNFQEMIKDSGIYSEAVFHICSMGYEEYIRDALVAAGLIRFFSNKSEKENPDSYGKKPQLRIYGAHYKGKFQTIPHNDGLVDGNKVKILRYLAGDRKEPNPNALKADDKEFDNLGALKNTEKGDVIIFDDGDIGDVDAKDFKKCIFKQKKGAKIWQNCIWGADVGRKEGDIDNHQDIEPYSKNFGPSMLLDTEESFWSNNKSIKEVKKKIIAVQKLAEEEKKRIAAEK